MAPLATFAGLEVVSQWFSPEGAVFSLFIFLLLCTFLTALCTNCGRHSFELRQSEVERTPSSLIRVVKLEDVLSARENPMINEIINDEKESPPENSRPVVVEISPGIDNAAFTMPTRSLTEQDQISNGKPVTLAIRDPSPVPEPVTDDISNVQVSEYPLSSEPMSVMDIESQEMPVSSFPASAETMLDTLALSDLDPEVTELEMISPPEQFGPTDLLGEVDLTVEPIQEATPEQGVSAEHIYDTIGQKESDGVQLDLAEAIVEAAAEADISSPELEQNALANCEPGSLQEEGVAPSPLLLLEEEGNDLDDRGWNPMYARISRKENSVIPPVPPSGDYVVFEEDFAPPLPDRITELE